MLVAGGNICLQVGVHSCVSRSERNDMSIVLAQLTQAVLIPDSCGKLFLPIDSRFSLVDW